MLTYKSHRFLLSTGAGQRRGLTPAHALRSALIWGRDREDLAWAGTRRGKESGDRAR